MKGFPRHLNSKADYLNAHALALTGELEMSAMKARWQSLLNTANHYVFDHLMSVGEQPPAPEPAYRICEETPDGATTKTLFRLEADPNSTLARFGFTTDEIHNLIIEMEA